MYLDNVSRCAFAAARIFASSGPLTRIGGNTQSRAGGRPGGGELGALAPAR